MSAASRSSTSPPRHAWPSCGTRPARSRASRGGRIPHDVPIRAGEGSRPDTVQAHRAGTRMNDEPAGPGPGPAARGREHARLAARLTGFVPAVSWVPGYKPAWFSRDAVAGFTIWGLLVPEMIAYASLAGLPPQAGLYTLLASLALYAIFGTSRQLVVAGTSAAAVLGYAAVTALGPKDRKSTRLNSSHMSISYAVFCL